MIVTLCERPAVVVGDACHRLGAQLRDELAEVAAPGSALIPRQRPGQSDCSVGPIARNVDGGERVGVVGVDDGVEDQPLDVLRVGARVGDRELGAVGDAEQRELLDAELRRGSPPCPARSRRVV